MAAGSASAPRAISSLEPQPLFRPGRNCWQVARAGRAAVLIDGGAYYSAFADAAMRARHSIRIVGWDFNSAVRLRPGDASRGDADCVGPFLNRLARRRRDLDVYVLDWDFSVIYALQRELLPRLRWARNLHRRFHFRLDNHHPLGAAQHQKVVVIDDAMAFVGGFDFAACRWDTPDHLAENPHRVDPWGKPYPPYHDIVLAVDGAAAAGLGELFRERWRRATGERLGAAPPGLDPWPATVPADFENVDVAIARTMPAYDGEAEIREIEALYADAIAAARHWIYIENQYLTSAAIGAALLERLQEPDGPEILIVQPRVCEGWLEETAMGVLRARLLRKLDGADRQHRLRVVHPIVPELGHRRMTVHSKALIVDDRLLRIGSANLNNRSMGLDSECDLAIDAAGDTTLQARIAAVRDRLLAEHLGQPPERVAETLRATGSLLRTVDVLNTGERGLRPLDPTPPEWLDQLVTDGTLLDPERPVDAEALLALFAPSPSRGGRRIWLWLSAAAAAVTLVALVAF